MDVVAESGVGHLEAGIGDAVPCLQGAWATGFVVDGYDRYNGGLSTWMVIWWRKTRRVRFVQRYRSSCWT